MSKVVYPLYNLFNFNINKLLKGTQQLRLSRNKVRASEAVLENNIINLIHVP
jgi:hypothetical protein